VAPVCNVLLPYSAKLRTSRLFLHHNPYSLPRFFSLLLFFTLLSLRGFAQTPVGTQQDSSIEQLPRLDTIRYAAPAATFSGDSISKRPDTVGKSWNIIDSLPLESQVLARHPYYDFRSRPRLLVSGKKEFRGKEMLFYVTVGLVMFFALLKLAFAKYFNDLFRVFFRTTLKQRQIKEQLMQTPLPSLAFNIFFVASAGLYLNYQLQYFNLAPVENFWLMYLYCCIGLSVIYLVKFVGLIICGWLFNMQKAADSYIFIVFIINKVIGITLLPFVVLLGFSDGVMYSVALLLSWCCVGALVLYRFILGFTAIRNEVRFNLFHFFLYLCAFEVAPLLLIYKLLLFFF
jgi:hypothetical protein